jgi:hypothetical protein
MRLAAMKIACLFGRHWPAAALSPFREAVRTSECIDCKIGMKKSADGVWRAAPHRTDNPRPWVDLNTSR